MIRLVIAVFGGNDGIATDGKSGAVKNTVLILLTITAMVTCFINFICGRYIALKTHVEAA